MKIINQNIDDELKQEKITVQENRLKGFTKFYECGEYK